MSWQSIMSSFDQGLTSMFGSGGGIVTLTLKIFVAVLFTLFITSFWSWFAKKISKRLAKSKSAWDDAIFNATVKPIYVGLWLFCVGLLSRYWLSLAILKHWPKGGASVIVVALIAWAAIRFFKAAEANLVISAKKKAAKKINSESPHDSSMSLFDDPTTIIAVGKLLRLTILITSILIGLQAFGISISAVLAFGGVGGLAIGFAAQDLLANFFGGLIIYFDRPFVPGDWVRSPDREIEGTVEEIGWRQTRIRKFDSRPLYVPNSVFNNIAVENPSRMNHRVISETIGLRYDDFAKVRAITAAVESYLKANEHIATEQTLMVSFDKFNDSSLDFFIYCFTKTTKWVKYHQIKQEILLDIGEIIAKHGAEIAYPTKTLHHVGQLPKMT